MCSLYFYMFICYVSHHTTYRSTDTQFFPYSQIFQQLSRCYHSCFNIFKRQFYGDIMAVTFYNQISIITTFINFTNSCKSLNIEINGIQDSQNHQKIILSFVTFSIHNTRNLILNVIIL